MIFIFATEVTPRLRYTLDFVFNTVLSVGYSVSTNTSQVNERVPAINYSSRSDISGIQMIPCGLLAEDFVSEDRLVDISDLLANMRGDNEDFKPADVDIFSFIFFCLSRYEEYIKFKGDHHDRFTSECSIVSKYKILNRAMVDECIDKFKHQIIQNFPEYCFPDEVKFRLISTIDIDQAWAFANKGWRSAGSIGKDMICLKFKDIKRKLNALLYPAKDPFYTFDYILELHRRYDIHPVFFFLLSDQVSKYDKNQNPLNFSFRRLISHIADLYTVGIHPSYVSNTHRAKMASEKKMLEEICGTKIKHSRQHFLMLNFPQTYHQLLDSGITDDYTMGYADSYGYRASTGHSFLWYDLTGEKVTTLRIHPFQVMDVTLKNYMKLTPDKAIKLIQNLINYSKKVNIPMGIIWHNSSLDEERDWKGWTPVYESIFELSKGK